MILYLDLSSSSLILSLATLIYYLIYLFQNLILSSVAFNLFLNPYINAFLEVLLASFSNLLCLFLWSFVSSSREDTLHLKKKICSIFSFISVKIFKIWFHILCLKFQYLKSLHVTLCYLFLQLSLSWKLPTVCTFDLVLWVHVPWSFICENFLRLRQSWVFPDPGLCWVYQSSDILWGHLGVRLRLYLFIFSSLLRYGLHTIKLI